MVCTLCGSACDNGPRHDAEYDRREAITKRSFGSEAGKVP